MKVRCRNTQKISNIVIQHLLQRREYCPDVTEQIQNVSFPAAGHTCPNPGERWSCIPDDGDFFKLYHNQQAVDNIFTCSKR